MPGFSSPFTGMDFDRKLNAEELLAAVRFMHAAELEAIQMYRQVAEATDDATIKQVVSSIADEEVVHAGEFQALADKLSSSDAELIEKGKQEAKERRKRLGTVAAFIRSFVKDIK